MCSTGSRICPLNTSLEDVNFRRGPKVKKPNIVLVKSICVCWLMCYRFQSNVGWWVVKHDWVVLIVCWDWLKFIEFELMWVVVRLILVDDGLCLILVNVAWFLLLLIYVCGLWLIFVDVAWCLMILIDFSRFVLILVYFGWFKFIFNDCVWFVFSLLDCYWFWLILI